MTILIAALAACGAFLISWTVFEALLMPLPEEDTYLIVYLRGDTAQVQQRIRACDWLRERRGVRGKVIYVDTGLAEDVRQAAQKMIGEDSSLLLCKAGEEYLELEKWKRGSGAD